MASSSKSINSDSIVSHLPALNMNHEVNDVESSNNFTQKYIHGFPKWIFNKNRQHVSRNGYTEFGSLPDSLNSPGSGRTLSTFSGVFSPVSLSMFSALLFLRVGFVVGNSGLLATLLQFLIAYTIIYCTVASVCAVATNGEVEGGGAYFMISRTLGPEFGGSIGTLFFLANIVSSALYIVGFSEGLINNFGPNGAMVGEVGIPTGPWWPFIYSSILNFINLIVCLVGASFFAKTNFFVFIIVTCCIASSFISFFFHDPISSVDIPESNHHFNRSTNASYTGLSWKTLNENLFSLYGTDYTSHDLINSNVTFAIVFGVLFSGVTGIMAGANMSGELKNPAKSIPRGTISAVTYTMIIYTLMTIFTAATCSRALLQNDYLYLMPINYAPICIAVGILTATFSASLSNIIGSSRVLEALARDGIYGNCLDFVTRGTWKSNPIVAVFISWFLVQMMLLVGSLNLIAQINSILFLLAYLALNLACLGLELASAPNFRPSYKYFSWYTAAIGLIGSWIMMFVINPLYASSSIGLCLAIILFLHLFSPARSAEWGSISQALIFHQVRKYLLLLDSRKDHVKFWRPQMLLMVNNPQASAPLTKFVNDLKKSGLFVLGHVKVIPNYLQLSCDPVAEEYTDWLRVVDILKVKAFIEITVAKSVREGLHHLIRISGMGAMKPNTIIFGFYDSTNPEAFLLDVLYDFNNGTEKFPLRTYSNSNRLPIVDYVDMIRDVLALRRNVCICRNFHKYDKLVIKRNKQLYVDVWAMNFFDPHIDNAFDTTSLFMLQLSCIITMVQDWKHLRLRVYVSGRRVSNDSEGNMNVIVEKFRVMLQSLRINATIHQVTTWPDNIPSSFDMSSINGMPEDVRSYYQRVNEIIKAECNNTAVVFTYLPAPSQDHFSNSVASENYLQCLTTITENLPPTVMVHGISAVTSTTL